MAINKAVLAAMRAAGKVAPDIRQSYKAIRVAEDVIGAAGLVDPRCRIEDVFVQAPDGYAIPCRVFTPLDIDFSWREGFQVSEDFAGTILFFHGGGWANGDVDYYSDSCVRTAVRLARRVVSVEYRRSPPATFKVTWICTPPTLLSAAIPIVRPCLPPTSRASPARL